MQQLTLTIPKPYHFAASVCDHGWPALAPFRWTAETATLERVERLTTGQVVLLALQAQDQTGQVQITIDMASDRALTAAELAEVTYNVRWMLKLDRDYNDFYALAARHAWIGRVVSQGRGRLLRSPVLWEDVVKTIATTNVTWGNTKSMIARLVETLGDPFPLDPSRRAFPTPHQVAQADPALFANLIRMGYRNAYVQQLAQEVVTGTRDLEGLRQSPLRGAALKKAVKSIKGIGDYAAHTLMMILGDYSEVPIDSEYRSFVLGRYFAGQTPTAKELAAIYADWGEWKYLAYWFDHYD